MTMTILLAMGVLLALAVAFALLLGWASVRWHVDVPLQLRQLQDAMPGANCGGCGYVGCAEYAEAVFHGKAPATLCPVGGSLVARRLAAIMGVDIAETVPFRAVVHCNADRTRRLKQAPYHGEATCTAANLVGGLQGCTYGCLGLGDCFRACAFDALDMVQGLPRVNYDRCTGCGACARACPRQIISMVPLKAPRMSVVACTNKDPGKLVREVCKTGCIACKACERLNDLFKVTDNLARIDYGRYDAARDFDAPAAKCPTKVIVYAGTMPAADLAAVDTRHLPGGVKPDGGTTVDQTAFRG